jgi:hypothetical protein
MVGEPLATTASTGQVVVYARVSSADQLTPSLSWSLPALRKARLHEHSRPLICNGRSSA